jgi:hypothetical protein
MKRHHTFTLGEILAVIVVLGASATVLFPQICQADSTPDEQATGVPFAGFNSNPQEDTSI